MEIEDSTVELLKIILDFITKMAYPIILGGFIFIFKQELRLILLELKKILDKVRSGELEIRSGDVAIMAAQRLRQEPLDAAAKKIQKLLSPAAPLAVGYVHSFIEKIKLDDSGIKILKIDGREPGPEDDIIKAITICIPCRLTDRDISLSTEKLVKDRYPTPNTMKTLEVRSNMDGKPLRVFAILHENRLYPVDVPQTMTSIRLVLEFRKKDLIFGEGGMTAKQIEDFENENLNEFAALIEEKIKELRLTNYVRVIREGSYLFLPFNSKV